jgi:hypothetical protein
MCEKHMHNKTEYYGEKKPTTTTEDRCSMHVRIATWYEYINKLK